MPNPSAETVGSLLKSSPLLKDEKALNDAFPSEADKAALVNLATLLDEAIAKNKKVEETWQMIANGKAVAIKLIGMALGKPF
jgi:anti-sigma factor ChrR (cupin superfamily)